MSEATLFERLAMKLVRKELCKGNLGLDPKLAKIRYKPAYFSRDRKKEIIFDFSIEVRRNGAVLPFLIWIWECKNYTHRVPVDDVEEFHAKLEQVGADKTKGSMITRLGFDKGSSEFAVSKGIGLWLLPPKETYLMVVADADLIWFEKTG